MIDCGNFHESLVSVKPGPETIKEHLFRSHINILWLGTKGLQPLLDFRGAQSTPSHVLVHVVCLFGEPLPLSWKHPAEPKPPSLKAVATTKTGKPHLEVLPSASAFAVQEMHSLDSRQQLVHEW